MPIRATLMTSFAQNGFDIINIIDEATTGRKIAIGAKGEIVVAGTAFQFGATEKFVVLFPPNNALVETSFDAFSVATGMAIQPDRKIVVAGFTAASPSELAPRSLAVARYNPDGFLDATFGDGGKVTTPIGVGGSLLFTPEAVGHKVGGIVIQSNGRIVVSGTLQRPRGPVWILCSLRSPAMVSWTPHSVRAVYFQSNGSGDNRFWRSGAGAWSRPPER